MRPKDIDHLSTFRGLNKGEVKLHSEAIFKALEETAEDHEVSVPKASKVAIPTSQESQVLDVLRCYVNILAEKHQIAAKHLMTAQQLLPLLRNRVENKEDLKALRILSGDAADLIGEDLLAMVQGKRALWINNSQIETMDTAKSD